MGIYGDPPGPGFAQLAQGVVANVALGWRSLAEADSGRIHDCWACPPSVIYGEPSTPGFAKLVGDGGAAGLKSHKSPSSNDCYARSHGKMTLPRQRPDGKRCAAIYSLEAR